jgi:uncharacterized protein YerC
MAVAALEGGPLLYDEATRRFDRVLLRRAMIRRGITPRELERATGLSRAAITKVRSGLSVSDTTAIAVLRVLEDAPPMEVLGGER